MEKEKSLLSLNLVLKQRNILAATCALLIVSNTILAVTSLFSTREMILIPNGLDKETAISNKKMSPAYLEAITRDVIGLMLNITPSNTDYAIRSVLKITHPSFYGQLKHELSRNAEDVIKRRITTFYFPKSIQVTGDTKVMVTGDLSTYLGKEMMNEEVKSYSITYAYEGFKPLVIDFHEVDPKAKEEVINEDK
jgi:conjugal transfer pilus assembly protein TraE